MSGCDGIKIIFKNYATYTDKKGQTAVVVGLSPDKGTTISGIAIGTKINFQQTITAFASSGKGSNGWAGGKIVIQMLYGTPGGPPGPLENVTCTYSGKPSGIGNNGACKAEPSAKNSPHFMVTTSATSGKNSSCSQTFLIESTTAG